jgi:transcriptional regulator with XRE-family HTH domain
VPPAVRQARGVSHFKWLKMRQAKNATNLDYPHASVTRDDDPMHTSSLPLWRIGVIMRGLREDRNLTLRQAAKMLGTNKDRLERLESAKNQRADPGTVTGWAFKYGADEKILDELDALAMETLDPDVSSWESVFTTMPKWFTAFLALESEAVAIYSYEAEYLPGLLQIEEYVDAAAAVNPFMTTSESDEAKKVKLRRQKLVFGRPPGKLPKMVFIINEAALLRIQHEPWYEKQLQRLRESAALPGVEIYFVPLARGLHAAMAGSFKIMSFEGAYSPEVLYLESIYAAKYIDERRAVVRAREVLSETQTCALPIEEYLSNVEP